MSVATDVFSFGMLMRQVLHPHDPQPFGANAMTIMRKLDRGERPAFTRMDAPAAMRELGNLDRREMGRWKNNRAENSHLPFRRRERAMQRFRRMKSLQKFASVHASLHNHFSQERHLTDRQTYKERRSAALAEWQSLAA